MQRELCTVRILGLLHIHIMDIDQTPDTHEMLLVKIYETGAEEWLCPICSRRLVMQRPPQFRRIILVIGDELASHTASPDSLRSVGAAFSNTAAALVSQSPGDAEPGNLRVWADWLDQLDFSTLGSADTHR